MKQRTLQLEESLSYVPRQQVFGISMYGLEREVSVFYTGDAARPMIRVSGGGKGVVFPLGSLGLCLVKNIHETYFIDENGKLSKGHTTFTSNDNRKKRISHDWLSIQ